MPVPRSELAPACGADVRTMASAVFEGTSLVNMFVRDCWVNGIRRLIISQRGEEEDFFEIRTEWSDRNILYLHRSYSDLGRLFKRLLESFPEDRRELSKSPLIEGRSQRRETPSFHILERTGRGVATARMSRRGLPPSAPVNVYIHYFSAMTLQKHSITLVIFD